MLALALVDRLSAARAQPLTPNNAHRCWIAAFVVASKVHDDRSHSNRHYSKIAGIAVEDLNRLEGELLATLGFGVAVAVEEWRPYYAAAETVAFAAAAFGIRNIFVKLATEMPQLLPPLPPPPPALCCLRTQSVPVAAPVPTTSPEAEQMQVQKQQEEAAAAVTAAAASAAAAEDPNGPSMVIDSTPPEALLPAPTPPPKRKKSCVTVWILPRQSMIPKYHRLK